MGFFAQVLASRVHACKGSSRFRLKGSQHYVDADSSCKSRKPSDVPSHLEDPPKRLKSEFDMVKNSMQQLTEAKHAMNKSDAKINDMRNLETHLFGPGTDLAVNIDAKIVEMSGIKEMVHKLDEELDTKIKKFSEQIGEDAMDKRIGAT